MAEERVRVLVQREGGFAGMRLDTELDTAELAVEDAQSLRRLVTGAEADMAVLGPGTAGHPNVPTWGLWIRRGDQSWKVDLAATSIPAALRPLLDFVLERGHTSRSGPAGATD